MKVRTSFISNSSSSSYIIILTKKDFDKSGLKVSKKLIENIKLSKMDLILISHISGNDSCNPELDDEFYEFRNRIRKMKEDGTIDAIIRSQEW